MLRPGVFLSSKHRELDNELLIALLIRKRRNPQKKSHLKSSLGSCGPFFCVSLTRCGDLRAQTVRLDT